MKRYFCIGMLVGIVVCTVAEVAYGNIIAPTLFPGVLPLSVNWLLAIPTTVLVAVLERPFVRRAGVTEGTLRHCLWANVISTAVGFLISPITMWIVFSVLALTWLLVGVAGSVLIEGVYYRRFAQVEAKGLRWAWITAGNVLSSFLLLAMTPIAYYLEEHYRHLARLVQRHQPTILLMLALALGVVLWLAFVRGLPGRRRRRKGQAGDTVQNNGKEEDDRHRAPRPSNEHRTDEQISAAR